ncbi:MAG: lipopolysaccharide transport periplasmic protein LptA [Luteimonas sp.]
MNRRAASILPIALLATAGAWAKTTDRNQTMNVAANTSDCSVNESGPCILTGDVKIIQGTLDIQAAKADVRRSNGETSLVKLSGSPVQMKQQGDDGAWMNATAAQIDYDIPNDTIVLTGNANVQQPGRGSITGGRIVYNSRTGQVQSGGESGGGRVQMKFEPKNKAPAAAAPPPAATGGN